MYVRQAKIAKSQQRKNWRFGGIFARNRWRADITQHMWCYGRKLPWITCVHVWVVKCYHAMPGFDQHENVLHFKTDRRRGKAVVDVTLFCTENLPITFNVDALESGVQNVAILLYCPVALCFELHLLLQKKEWEERTQKCLTRHRMHKRNRGLTSTSVWSGLA